MRGPGSERSRKRTGNDAQAGRGVRDRGLHPAGDEPADAAPDPVLGRGGGDPGGVDYAVRGAGAAGARTGVEPLELAAEAVYATGAARAGAAEPVDRALC